MTTGRINQITIFKQYHSNGVSQERAEQGVVRFRKRLYVPSSNSDSNASEPLKDLCFHDLQPTRMRLVKRRWENPSTVYKKHSSLQTYFLQGFRLG